MKTKITILALLLCFPLFLAAQNDNINENDSLTPQKGYKSFFGGNKTKHSIAFPVICKNNDNNELNKNHYLGCCFTEYLSLGSEDTATLDGQTYFTKGYQYLREDTTFGRLYRRTKEDTSEIVVCDMSLSIGDSFALPTRESSLTNIMLYVDSIAYTEDFGKIILFKPENGTSYYISGELSHVATEHYQIPMAFIEGIGPTYSFMGGYHSMGLSVLLCVEKDDTLTYMTNELLGCDQWLPPAVNDNDKSASLHVYPNPASQRVSVGVGDWGGGGTLRLVNAIGMVLQTKEITDNVMEFDISDYANGLYTILYTDDKNNRAAVKFVKQ